MELSQRIELLAELGNYILEENNECTEIKERASAENAWFIPQFIDYQCNTIAKNYLNAQKLQKWVAPYNLQPVIHPKKIGIVMAGNIPMAGLHDLLSVFIAGHQQVIKLSSKDRILLPHLVKKLIEWNPLAAGYFNFAEILKGCDAYIATGSNNSARYFEYYFSKYPHIIRKNRTSVAILSGEETNEDLEKLADDVYLYFGLGCRNVTKLYVPEGYDFVPLIESWKKYNYLFDFHKYKSNYDYQLSLRILNNDFYMTDGAVLLQEHPSIFSAVSVVHYEFYTNPEKLTETLATNTDIQAITGNRFEKFGSLQQPQLTDFADGADTLKFLQAL